MIGRVSFQKKSGGGRSRCGHKNKKKSFILEKSTREVQALLQRTKKKYRL